VQITVSTLSDIRDHGYRLQAHCRCTYYATVDIDALIAVFGPDFDCVDGREAILSKLKCSECGATPTDLLLMPGKQWGGGS